MTKALLLLLTLLPITTHAAGKISLSIDSELNVASNSIIEACGTATHADGIKPLLISINHNGANYTALTNENGKWCILFRRSNFDGKFDVSGSTLDFKDKTNVNFN